jgi:hypothetical protein
MPQREQAEMSDQSSAERWGVMVDIELLHPARTSPARSLPYQFSALLPTIRCVYKVGTQSRQPQEVLVMAKV